MSSTAEFRDQTSWLFYDKIIFLIYILLTILNKLFKLIIDDHPEVSNKYKIPNAKKRQVKKRFNFPVYQEVQPLMSRQGPLLGWGT